MLTQSDLQAIGKLIDQKLDIKLAPIQAKISEIEQNQSTKSDIFQMQTDLTSINKRLSNVETIMVTKTDSKAFATVFDLRKAFRGVVRQKDLKALENRLREKLNKTSDAIDSLMVDLEKRTAQIEKYLKSTSPQFTVAS